MTGEIDIQTLLLSCYDQHNIIVKHKRAHLRDMLDSFMTSSLVLFGVAPKVS